jgi:hypothetical protein
VVEGVYLDKANAALRTPLGQLGHMLDAGVTLWDAIAKGISICINAKSVVQQLVTKDVVAVERCYCCGRLACVPA